MVNLPESQVRQNIRNHFYKHADIKDDRVIDMLLEKGYMDLEDTLLQHKQKNHVMLLLEGYIGDDLNSKWLSRTSSVDEQFARNEL